MIDDIDFLNSKFDQLRREIGNLHFRQLLIQHERQEKRRVSTWVTGKWSPIYRSPYDGKKTSYSAHGIDSETEYQSILSEQQNSMYRWLIVDCYEFFNKYLKSLKPYILAGPNITNSGRHTRLCEECGDKIGRKSMFDQLASRLHQSPDFNLLLKKACIDIDLDVAVLVLSEFRNIIVHKAGKLSDFEGFVDRIMVKASWSGLDKRRRVYNFSCDFVTTKHSPLLPENLNFLERPFKGSSLPGHHLDLYQELSGCFVGYAELVRDCLVRRLEL
ncbi:hypothetical protein [Gilvimarinus polysaccharolyticus]|uniref:hypothetical protein n=1 Tax=Gilvimarinus polysaccharolyticus TaxID=863921 RepID=UPI000673A324|nr:hypothetical protein [Gilvimarinus polysaccharolyticus]